MFVQLRHLPHFPAWPLAAAGVAAGLALAWLPVEWTVAALAGLLMLGLALWEPTLALCFAIILGPARAFIATARPDLPADFGQVFFALAVAGWLARALARLEQQPLPARLEGVGASMFGHLAPEMQWKERLLFSNLWLTAPMLRALLEAAPSSAALVRTTTALTMLEAGVKENVIPGSARAVVNFRLLPGDGSAQTIERVRAMGVKAFYKHFKHDGVHGPNMATVYSDRGQGVRAPVVFYNRCNEAAIRLSSYLIWFSGAGPGVCFFELPFPEIFFFCSGEGTDQPGEPLDPATSAFMIGLPVAQALSSGDE